MATTPHVRPARPSDREALGALGAELVRFHHQLDPARFLRGGDDLAEGYGGWLVREAAREGAVVLVAELDGRVVGYAYGTVEGRNWNDLLDAHGKLHDVLVEAPARGRGVARALVESLRDHLTARGCPRVVLATAVGNDAARALFEKLGFRPSMIELSWGGES